MSIELLEWWSSEYVKIRVCPLRAGQLKGAGNMAEWGEFVGEFL